MEKPIFNIQEKTFWKSINAIAWASSVIFDTLENTIDQIRKNDRVVKLPEVLHDLPETQILLETFLRNLLSIIFDVIDPNSSNFPFNIVSYTYICINCNIVCSLNFVILFFFFFSFF